MKAQLTTDEIGRVTLSYDFEDCNGVTRVERTFSCPPEGGYVIEKYPSGDWKQVCDRLSNMGSTCSCSSRDKLPDMIRREYQAMRRAEKREANRCL